MTSLDWMAPHRSSSVKFDTKSTKGSRRARRKADLWFSKTQQISALIGSGLSSGKDDESFLRALREPFVLFVSTLKDAGGGATHPVHEAMHA
jgi:hypothetical protein